MICEQLSLPSASVDLTDLEKMIHTITHPKGKITIGVVGKYVQHQDAYKSIFEALDHGAIAAGYDIEIKRFEADKIFNSGDVVSAIEGCDGYLVPGGFGERGWEGKIQTAKYCRENKIPYFGICLGMQILSVEFARYAAKIEDANSTEVDPNAKNPIISLLSEQADVKDMGGTMRLGAQMCLVKKGTLAHKIYEKELICERHRHRFEFNNAYKEEMEKAGFIISGTQEQSGLCEIAEVSDHPWMIGVQFHPEFQSKPTNAHPLFREFVKAAINYHKGNS